MDAIVSWIREGIVGTIAAKGTEVLWKARLMARLRTGMLVWLAGRIAPGERVRLLEQIQSMVNKEYEETERRLKSYSADLDVVSILLDLETDRRILEQNAYNTLVVTSANLVGRYDGQGTYHGRYVVKGRNGGTEPLSEVIAQVGASEVVTGESLELRVGSGRPPKEPGQGARPRWVDSENVRKKIFAISFEPAISPGQQFLYWYEFRWPNVGNDRVNSDTINLRELCPTPPVRVEHQLRFPYKPEEFHLLEVHGGRITGSNIKPAPARRVRDSEEWICRYVATAPLNDAFLVYWVRP